MRICAVEYDVDATSLVGREAGQVAVKHGAAAGVGKGDPNRMTNFGTSFDVEMGVARKDRTHGQTLTTR